LIGLRSWAKADLVWTTGNMVKSTLSPYPTVTVSTVSGSGISTDQRGAGLAPTNQDQGQQPGGLAGAKLSPQQRDDMRALLRDGRVAAERQPWLH